jgi:hypothetical protein
VTLGSASWSRYTTELSEFVNVDVGLDYDGAVASRGLRDVEWVASSGVSLEDSQVCGYVICGWMG